MNEIQMVSELGQNVPLPDRDELEPTRRRVLAAIAAEPGTAAARPAPPRPRRVRTLRRLVLAGGLAALAASVAAALVVVSSSPVGGPPVVVELAAEEVLRRAAVTAAAQPELTPRPDQFVFVETSGDGWQRRAWHSVDGTRDGRIWLSFDAQAVPLPGCHDGRRAVVKGSEPIPGMAEPCEPMPAVRSDLPTDADAMLAYLRGQGGGELNGLAKDALALIQESYLPPKARAALYEAATRIPGLEVVPDEVDGAGRHGIGVAWSYQGSRHVLIFDPKTYHYLGSAYTPPPASGGAVSREAVVALTIVDQVGQLP